MVMQLLESAKKKNSLRQGKKKQALTPSKSSEEEENAIHVELSSKHSEPTNSEEGGSDRINKLEWRLDVVVNRGKLQDVAATDPICWSWTQSATTQIQTSNTASI